MSQSLWAVWHTNHSVSLHTTYFLSPSFCFVVGLKNQTKNQNTPIYVAFPDVDTFDINKNPLKSGIMRLMSTRHSY